MIESTALTVGFRHAVYKRPSWLGAPGEPLKRTLNKDLNKGGPYVAEKFLDLEKSRGVFRRCILGGIVGAGV